MRIYLDLCIYNRPFDDQHQPRIVIETIEFLFLLSEAIDKKITIINSFVLEDENSKNPFIDRKNKIYDLLKVALEFITKEVFKV